MPLLFWLPVIVLVGMFMIAEKDLHKSTLD